MNELGRPILIRHERDIAPRTFENLENFSCASEMPGIIRALSDRLHLQWQQMVAGTLEGQLSV